MTCPLCQSGDGILLESIRTSDLARLYQRELEIDVSRLLSHVDKINYHSCSTCDLKYFLPAVTGDNRFYESLQRFPWYYEEDKQEFSFAASHVQPHDRVLEIGSGKGAFHKYIKDNPYVGLEFNDKAIASSRSRGLDIRKQSIEAHADETPDSYDVVCNFQVLEHVSTPNTFLDSCAGCLKPGGKLIVSVPSHSSFSRFLVNHLLDLPPHHLTRWTDDSLRYIGNICDLSLLQIWHEPLQPLHFSLYTKTIAAEALGYRPGRLLDNSMRGKVVWSVASGLAKFYQRGLNHPTLLPSGISVTAVYKKG